MRRRTYIALILVTVGLGLLVHMHGTALAPALRDILGDTLWAMNIVWVVSFVAPRAPLATRAAVALAICFAVELSQLIDHRALDAARHSLIGHLLIGSDFDARDFVAYTAGVAIATLLVKAAARHRGEHDER